MQHYLDMWRNFGNFSGTTSREAYWMAVLFNFIISCVITFVSGLIGITFLANLYTWAVLVPSLAMSIRRFRDAGYNWTNIFWVFLPIVGLIIYIVRLCKPTASASNV